MKFITFDETFDEQGRCDFDWKSYKKYAESIRAEIPDHIAKIFEHGFHDDSFTVALAHCNGTIELVDHGGDGIMFFRANVRSTSLEKIGQEIWATPDEVFVDELTLLPSKKFLWSIIFAGRPHTYLSIEFEDAVQMKRGSGTAKTVFESGIDETFRFYGELCDADMGSDAYDKAELAYKRDLLKLKDKLDWDVFRIFSENRLRYSSPRHIVDYGNGEVEICFSNNVSLRFTGGTLLSVHGDAARFTDEWSRVKLWHWKKAPCWFFEELRHAEADNRFHLHAKTDSGTISLAFGGVCLSSVRKNKDASSQKQH